MFADIFVGCDQVQVKNKVQVTPFSLFVHSFKFLVTKAKYERINKKPCPTEKYETMKILKRVATSSCMRNRTLTKISFLLFFPRGTNVSPLTPACQLAVPVLLFSYRTFFTLGCFRWTADELYTHGDCGPSRWFDPSKNARGLFSYLFIFPLWISCATLVS